MYHYHRKHGKFPRKPDTHEEWLQKIKDAEEKVNEEKRKLREEQKLKRLEEEEKYDFRFFVLSVSFCLIII